MKKEPTLNKIKLKPLFRCMLNTQTHHNKADKVYPVPERVSVLKYGSLKVKISNSNLTSFTLFNLNKIHNVCPALQRYNKEDGHPGQADVVKRNGTVKWVSGPCGALGVVLK